MSNMSVKIGEARERMFLKTWKFTLSLDCRTRSVSALLKGASANFSGEDETLGFEGGMTGETEGTVSKGRRLPIYTAHTPSIISSA